MSASAPREKKEEIVKEEKENKRKKKGKNQGVQEAERKQDTSHCHKECIPRRIKDNNSHRPREG